VSDMLGSRHRTDTTLHVIAVYHNTGTSSARASGSGSGSFQAHDELEQVISVRPGLPATTSAEQAAEWARRAYAADLEQVEANRSGPAGETAFLSACVYRLLRLRPLSTGDVLAITVRGATTWLTWDSGTWRRIDEPQKLTGGPLTARTIDEGLRATWYRYDWTSATAPVQPGPLRP
jgi:hypothetical protein